MFCLNCGRKSEGTERFCRNCGSSLATPNPEQADNPLVNRSNAIGGLEFAPQRDPDVLIGNGMASVFIGDGFFMVAVILSATNTTFSSLLWLVLLIPAFIFFGKGFRDIWEAKQIQRRLKQRELITAETSLPLPPQHTSIFATIKRASGELASESSVTERTTRQLE